MAIVKQIQQMLQLIRFSHTLFALPFALVAALLAWSLPPVGADASTEVSPLAYFRWQELAGVLLCMVTARSAAMAFNRLVDRDVDADNPRTASRHLPAGSVSVQTVIGFLVVMSASFVAATLLFLPNRWPLYLSIPVLAFVCFYSYTKRFTFGSHFFLGASLLLAPVCTWIALRGEALVDQPLDLVPSAILGLVVMAWVAGFDIIYACQDFEFDRRRGLRSVPSRFGIPNALRIAAGCHALTVAALIALPLAAPQTGLAWIYYVGVGLITLLLIYEHSIVRPDDLTRVNLAFFNVNIIISLGLFAVVALDIFLR